MPGKGKSEAKDDVKSGLAYIMKILYNLNI